MDRLGFSETKLTVEETKDGPSVLITLPEEEMGALIGHHGETITSLQTILNLIINQNQSTWTRVLVNIGDYRQRREKILEEMAQKAADNAKSTGKEVILSYLPSHERRTIHLLLEKNKDIETYSEGTGKYRRLVIKPTK